MKKKILGAVLVTALLTTAANAASCVSPTGFYVGAQTGLVNTNGKYDLTPTDSTGSISLGGNGVKKGLSNNFGKTGGLLGLVFGYTANMNGFVLGGEFGIGFENTNITLKDDSSASNPSNNANGDYERIFKTTYKRSMNYNVVFTPGVVLGNSNVLSLRLGVDGGKRTLEVKDLNNDSNSKKVSKSGLQPLIGIGFTSYLSNKMALGLTVDYVAGSKMSINDHKVAVGKTGGVIDYDKFNHTAKSINQIRSQIRLAYVF